MNEMIRAAEDRQAQLGRRIAEHEAQISDLQAEVEKLNTFVGLAKELFVSGDAPPPAQAPEVAQPKPQAVAPDSIQHAKQAERPPVMPARQPRSA